MKDNMTPTVWYINRHLDDNDVIVCNMLTDYMHTSYRYSKRNMDGSYLTVQPGWPNEYVISYRRYYDKELENNHKANRIIICFKSGSETEISLYKFKKFAKNVRKYA